jgi:hypothetical protein
MPMSVTSVEAVLKAEGPCLSSQVCARLQEGGLSGAAARQRVARAGAAVLRLQGLVFPRGTRFLYLAQSFGTHAFWEALVRDIGTSSPAYSAAIGALLGRGGIVPEDLWDVISGSPLKQKRQLASHVVLERLLAVRLVERIEIVGVGACIALCFNGIFGRSNDEAFKARLMTEKMVLLAMRDWARSIGAASYNKVAIRTDGTGLPRVGTFVWDLSGPTYLRAIVRRGKNGKPKPGFLVCDVVGGGKVLDEAAVSAFVRKCELTASMRNMAPLWPILIADRFTPQAFNLGRTRGIMVTTPGIIFGRDVATGLASLLQTLTRAAAIAVERPEAIGELFDKLGRIEGAAANLRGALFELLVGHCVTKIDDGSIDIGKIVSDSAMGGLAEIDVFRVKEHREVWAYECKAHQPAEVVNVLQVKRWVEEKAALIYRVLQREERFRESRFHFEYWTCGAFSTDALEYLKAAAGRTQKYSIGWKDGAAVRAYVGKLRPKSIADMFDQHFFRHPLTQLVEDEKQLFLAQPRNEDFGVIEHASAPSAA